MNNSKEYDYIIKTKDREIEELKDKFNELENFMENKFIEIKKKYREYEEEIQRLLNETELLSYYEKLNNELQNINHIMKLEKNEKKVKLLSSMSENINTVLLKLNIIKLLNEKLK